MKIHPNLTIGHIASEMEAAILYFEKWNIDYTLEGDRTLSSACEAAGIPVSEAVGVLGNIPEHPSVEGHWESRPLSELIDHILLVHHRYARSQIGKLNKLLETAVRVHGFKNPQLIMLKELFLEMSGEMQGHMAKEEELLFPYLAKREAAEAAHQELSNPFAESPFFRQPVRVLQWEHRMTGEEWVQIHLLTDNYRLMENADAELRALFQALMELEQDLHRHVHLENNVLFHRAIEKGWIQ